MQPWYDPAVIRLASIILHSYETLLGSPLLHSAGSAQEQAQALFEAPFVLAAHGCESDPILNYGNRQALALWELEWEHFVRTPSSQPAEPVHRDARQAALEQVARQGYTEHYSGVRISHSGRRFPAALCRPGP